ncbi:MAG: response regulator [bacterium]|nr:response regulator [bacterium]
MSEKASTILLVEDNPAHAELIIRIFQQHCIANTLYHMQDGEEALNYLFRKGDCTHPESSPRPDLILLDLRLPKKDGFEVLQEVKNSENLRKIPLIVLSTSDAGQDIRRAYAAHANSYLMKPVEFQKFAELLDRVAVYWLHWNCRMR